METEEGGIIIITTNQDEFLDVTGGEVVSLAADYEPYITEDDEQVVMVTPSSDMVQQDNDLKRRRSTYSVSKKLEILQKYETIYKRNARRTERETGVPRKCIQRWLQQRDKIEELAKSYYDEYGNEVRSYTVRESRAVFPELEAELAGYVVQRHGVTRSEVSRLAMDIFPSIYPSKDPSCFKASKHWFNNFMQRLKEGVDYVPKCKAREELERVTQGVILCKEEEDSKSTLYHPTQETLDISDAAYGIKTISPMAADVVAKNSQRGNSLMSPESSSGKEEVGKDEAGSRRCRSTYSLPFKHSVIQKFYNDFGQSITRTSKALDIPRKCIHRWVQQQSKIEALLQVSSNGTNDKTEQTLKTQTPGRNDALLSTGMTCYVKEKNLTKCGGSSTDLEAQAQLGLSDDSSSIPGRKGRAIYSLELKKDTIEKYDQLYNCSIRRTARETGIPRKCVQRWVRQRDKIEELVSVESGNRTCKVKVCETRKRPFANKDEDFPDLDNSAAGLRKRRRYFEERMLPIPPELEKLTRDTTNEEEGKVFVLQGDCDANLSDENSRIQPCAIEVKEEENNIIDTPLILACEEADEQQYDKSTFGMEHMDNGETIITVLPSDLMETTSSSVANSATTTVPGRRNRSSYSLSTKLSALDNYFNVYGQNCRKTAREMGIPRKCVQRWVQQRDKIQEWSQVKEHSVLKKLFTFRGRKPEYPELEKELMVIMRKMDDIGESFTVKQLGERAKDLFVQLYPDRDAEAFKASNHWVRNFLKRAQEGAIALEDVVDQPADSQMEQTVQDFMESTEDGSASSICHDDSGNAGIEIVSAEEGDNFYTLSLQSTSDEDGVPMGEFVIETRRSDGEDSVDDFEEDDEDDSIPSMISMANMIPLQ